MPVSWAAKKQGGVSLSTMEVEFVAASETARELLGVPEMLIIVGLAPILPMRMHVDNQAAIRQIEWEASSLRDKQLMCATSLLGTLFIEACLSHAASRPSSCSRTY